MEFNLPTIISTVSIIICILTFALNRRDNAIKETKEQDNECSNQKLIDYRLNQVEKKLDKILDILDSYDEVVKKQIDEVMAQHIALYHKGEK